jgi:hypothetical protein
MFSGDKLKRRPNCALYDWFQASNLNFCMAGTAVLPKLRAFHFRLSIFFRHMEWFWEQVQAGMRLQYIALPLHLILPSYRLFKLAATDICGIQ